MLVKLLLIGLGGAFGSVLRYVLSGWVQRLTGETFPWGTMAVNVLGCLAMGMLAAVFAGPTTMREEYRVAILVGVLGGFTTFSAFGRETFELVNDGQFLLAGANVLLSNALCLVAMWAGYRVTERLVGV